MPTQELVQIYDNFGPIGQQQWDSDRPLRVALHALQGHVARNATAGYRHITRRRHSGNYVVQKNSVVGGRAPTLASIVSVSSVLSEISCLGQ